MKESKEEETEIKQGNVKNTRNIERKQKRNQKENVERKQKRNQKENDERKQKGNHERKRTDFLLFI